jgi:hypothetical protein
MAEFLQKDCSVRLIEALERGSETLDRLQDNFKRILQGFAIYTLLEELPYKKVGKVWLFSTPYATHTTLPLSCGLKSSWKRVVNR